MRTDTEANSEGEEVRKGSQVGTSLEKSIAEIREAATLHLLGGGKEAPGRS